MSRKTRKFLTALLAVVLFGSLSIAIYSAVDHRRGEDAYHEAEDLVALPDISLLPPPVVGDVSGENEASDHWEEGLPEQNHEPVKEVYVDPYADALRNMDFAALQEVNSDVLGWILIPGTRVSYPLVQGEDNSYYLNHTWKTWRSAVGSIFLEYRSSRDFSDFNTIIYGHRMNNGSMFASLAKYKNQSYWKSNPCIYITDEAGTKKYDIFAAYEIGTTEDTYRVVFEDEQRKQEFIDFCLESSVIETGIVPTVYDKIVTLSTCTGRGHATRWVVQGRLQGEAPADSADDETLQDGERPPEEQMLPDGETSSEEQLPQSGTAVPDGETILEENTDSGSNGAADSSTTEEGAE